MLNYKTRYYFLVTLASLSLLTTSPSIVWAQSDPANFTTVVDVPPNSVGDNQSIDSNTQLNLRDGGSIGQRFQAGNADGSSSNVEVNIFGGEVASFFRANSGSTVNVLGGEMQGAYQFMSGSIGNIKGGLLGGGEDTIFRNGSTVHMSGGAIEGGGISVGDGFTLSGGVVPLLAGSNVSLVGDDFQLNGVPVPAGATSITEFNTLTGTLEDGTPFVFASDFDFINEFSLTTSAVAPANGTPIVATVASDPVPRGLRAGQMLTLSGTAVLPAHFTAVDAALNLDGGTIRSGIEAVRSDVTINGGVFENIQRNTLSAFTGSEVIITGGDIPGLSTTYRGGTLRMRGGAIDGLGSEQGGLVEISAGRVDDLSGATGGALQISGGVVNRTTLESGSSLTISGGRLGQINTDLDSTSEFRGADFLLNGSPTTSNSISLQDSDLLTGTLEDGTPFIHVASGRAVSLASTSVPANDSELFTVNAANPSEPKGIRAGQTLVLEEGGVINDFFTAVDGAVNINGGQVGVGLEVARTQVSITGGIVGGGGSSSRRDVFAIYGNSTLAVSGGVVESEVKVYPGNVANVTDGFVRNIDTVGPGTINITGGNVGIAASSGGVLNISGGNVEGVQAGFPADSVVNISAGASVGNAGLSSGGVLNMTGGTVQSFSGSGSGQHFLNISGGSLGSDARFSIRTDTGTYVSITGGSVGDFFDSRGRLELSGGSIGDFATLQGTSTISGGTIGDSLLVFRRLNLIGRQFVLDGVDITNTLVPDEMTLISDRNVVLSGILADGSAFSFDLNSSDLRAQGFDYFHRQSSLSLALVAIPEPSTFVMAIAALAVASTGLRTFRTA